LAIIPTGASKQSSLALRSTSLQGMKPFWRNPLEDKSTIVQGVAYVGIAASVTALCVGLHHVCKSFWGSKAITPPPLPPKSNFLLLSEAVERLVDNDTNREFVKHLAEVRTEIIQYFAADPGNRSSTIEKLNRLRGLSETVLLIDQVRSSARLLLTLCTEHPTQEDVKNFLNSYLEFLDELHKAPLEHSADSIRDLKALFARVEGHLSQVQILNPKRWIALSRDIKLMESQIENSSEDLLCFLYMITKPVQERLEFNIACSELPPEKQDVYFNAQKEALILGDTCILLDIIDSFQIFQEALRYVVTSLEAQVLYGRSSKGDIRDIINNAQKSMGTLINVLYMCGSDEQETQGTLRQTFNGIFALLEYFHELNQKDLLSKKSVSQEELGLLKNLYFSIQNSVDPKQGNSSNHLSGDIGQICTLINKYCSPEVLDTLSPKERDALLEALPEATPTPNDSRRSTPEAEEQQKILSTEVRKLQSDSGHYPSVFIENFNEACRYIREYLDRGDKKYIELFLKELQNRTQRYLFEDQRTRATDAILALCIKYPREENIREFIDSYLEFLEALCIREPSAVLARIHDRLSQIQTLDPAIYLALSKDINQLKPQIENPIEKLPDFLQRTIQPVKASLEFNSACSTLPQNQQDLYFNAKQAVLALAMQTSIYSEETPSNAQVRTPLLRFYSALQDVRAIVGEREENSYAVPPSKEGMQEELCIAQESLGKAISEVRAEENEELLKTFNALDALLKHFDALNNADQLSKEKMSKEERAVITNLYTFVMDDEPYPHGSPSHLSEDIDKICTFIQKYSSAEVLNGLSAPEKKELLRMLPGTPRSSRHSSPINSESD